MSRPLRIEFENALYHVTTRGNHREPIFVDDSDRTALLYTIGQGMARFDAVVFAYCFMGNHYHLVLRTRQANLSRLMQYVNGTYAQAHNRRHAKVGHLFQSRFHAILVQDDAYFLQACRYVDLNPVRASIVPQPHKWRWSSFRAHVGLARRPPWLDSRELHYALAPHTDVEDGRAAYIRFVAEGRDVRLWDDALSRQIYLGDEAFVHRMQEKIVGLGNESEIPRVQREFHPRPLQDYLDEADRDAGITRAHLEGGHKQAVIARMTGWSRSHICRLIARHRATKKT
jgi:REP element-mobilizing transposase RayT